MPKNAPKSVETTSVSNRRGCAGKMCSSCGRSLIINLLEQNQQQPNAATNVRCCLATHGPVRNVCSPINGSCSKINISNKIKLQRWVRFTGEVKAWRLQLLRTSHVDGEQICSTIAVCSLSQIYTELTRLVKGLNLWPQQFVNCTNHMCGARACMRCWNGSPVTC